MDINNDGVDDIISGSYLGDITMYKGLKGDGFDSPIMLDQVTDIKDRSLSQEVIFTNASFGDFNNDGLIDAFVGGIYGLRVMINEGTKENPKFGERTPILRVDGEQITTYKEQKLGENAKDFKSYIYFIDWDNDGVKDIMTTSSYFYEGQDPIIFHKGVETSEGLRFEKGVGLIKQGAIEKSLPGMLLMPHFCDYNRDGAMDILLGVTMRCNVKDNSFDKYGEYQFMVYPILEKMQWEIYYVHRKYDNNADDEKMNKEVEAIKTKYNLKLPAFYDSPDYKNKGYIILIQGVK